MNNVNTVGLLMPANPHHRAIAQLQIEIDRAKKEIAEYDQRIADARARIELDESEALSLQQYVDGLNGAIDLLEEYGAEDLKKEWATARRASEVLRQFQQQDNQTALMQQSSSVNEALNKALHQRAHQAMEAATNLTNKPIRLKDPIYP